MVGRLLVLEIDGMPELDEPDGTVVRRAFGLSEFINFRSRSEGRPWMLYSFSKRGSMPIDNDI
jgi:hypothetical protein